MRIRSSPGYVFSTPPLKKYVTCAYFSVSAIRSCVSPSRAMYSPKPLRIDCGGNATGRRCNVLRVAVDEHRIGGRDALPALVAVHRIVATADRGDPRIGILRAERGHRIERRFGTSGRRVASVEKRVDKHAGGAAFRR